MLRYVWAVGGLVWWSGCTREPTAEQRQEEVRACILQRLPPSEATATEWTVSGYALVEAYLGCHEKPEQATAADFRAVVRGLARQEADATRVRMAPAGDAP